MASSSSSSHSIAAASSPSCKYDVFLSFRGEDTRKTFVDHLYSALEARQICTYKDDQKLSRGESIRPSLFEAIEDSRIAIIIFSKNYADSSWCLDELAKIMKCRDERGLIVLPIFYDVEPSDVRNRKRKFGEAFAKQEAKNITKAKLWREALVDVSNIAGWEPKNIADGHESQFIEKIVDTILDRLFALNSCVDEDLVGMRARFQDLESRLDIGSLGVRMVGIWGVGGSGKTTLATSVYMEISQHFQSHCILENVREETSKYGLNKLQGTILSALFNKEVKVHSVVVGKHTMKKMLCRRKVLVLLDDVDELEQLEALAGKHNWFGSGSRIIITTRDEHLLRTHKVDHIYPIKLFSDDEAIQLFKRHAYNEEDPVEDYETLSLHAVSYASGLPLSLKVLGSFLYDKNKNEWISALKKLKDIPNAKVMNILKISYDGLESYEKELFLDIACFYRWRPTDDALEVFEACGYHPEIGIKVLTQKALITIVGGRFDMHDLIQEMGHYLVRGVYPNNPEKHSRIWKQEEIKDIPLQDETMEYDKIEAIRYEYDMLEAIRNRYDYDFSRVMNYDDSSRLYKIVSNMTNLRWIIVAVRVHKGEHVEGVSFLSNELRYIEWSYYPASPFPHSFQPMKLVVLKLSESMQKELWKVYQHLPHLKVLHLNYMRKLLTTPDFDGLPHLQKLTLQRCEELEEIHPSLGNHTSLENLKVSACYMLKRLPTVSQMKSMKSLIVTCCSLKDGEIPSGIGELSNLQELNLSYNNFSRLDFSLSQLTQLKILSLSSCDNLLELPELPSSLAILEAHHCRLLTIVEDFNKNCKQLCQVLLVDGWSDGLLQSMLKENTIESGCMHLKLEGLEIPKRFTHPLFRGGSCRLELPQNWCNDFSGFLMCFVFPDYFKPIRRDIIISMQQRSGMEYGDDVVWEERNRDRDMTWLWYVSFGSLRHTAWWDQTYNAISFNIESHNIQDIRRYCSGFGVRLVDRISRSGLTETSTNSSSSSSSPYTPNFKIQHDSASTITLSLSPYTSMAPNLLAHPAYRDKTLAGFTHRLLKI